MSTIFVPVSVTNVRDIALDTMVKRGHMAQQALAVLPIMSGRVTWYRPPNPSGNKGEEDDPWGRSMTGSERPLFPLTLRHNIRRFTIGSSTTNDIVIPRPRTGTQCDAADPLHCTLYPDYDHNRVIITNRSLRTTLFVTRIDDEDDEPSPYIPTSTRVALSADVNADRIRPGSKLAVYGGAWHLSLGSGLDLHMAFAEDDPPMEPAVLQRPSKQTTAPQKVESPQEKRKSQKSRVTLPQLPPKRTAVPRKVVSAQKNTKSDKSRVVLSELQGQHVMARMPEPFNQDLNRMLSAVKAPSRAMTFASNSQGTAVDTNFAEAFMEREQLDKRLALLLPENIQVEKEGEQTIVAQTKLSVVRKTHGEGTNVRWLAVKTLISEPQTLRNCTKAWYRECIILGLLSHVSKRTTVNLQWLMRLKPNIVKLVHTNEEHLMICTEFVEGGILDKAPANGFTEKQILNIWRDIIQALEYCHLRGISHNDIKGNNIIFCQDSEKATLIDFGMATGPDQQTNGGAPPYLSPEAIDGIRGPAADVWALGLVLLQIKRLMEVPAWTWQIAIHKVKEDGADRPAMRKWLDEIKDCVAQLPATQDLLKRMFDDEAETRITASELQRALRQMSL